MMYFPIDDVVRVTLVMMVLKEKWAQRDSMEKPENQAEKETEVWKTNLPQNANEYDFTLIDLFHYADSSTIWYGVVWSHLSQSTYTQVIGFVNNNKIFEKSLEEPMSQTIDPHTNPS